MGNRSRLPVKASDSKWYVVCEMKRVKCNSSKLYSGLYLISILIYINEGKTHGVTCPKGEESSLLVAIANVLEEFEKSNDGWRRNNMDLRRKLLDLKSNENTPNKDLEL